MYTNLEPSLSTTLGTNLSFNLGQTSSMSSVTSTIFILLVSVSFVASLGMVAYSGLLRMKATSPNEETEARNILQRAVYGPIGIIVMYLLLLTINPSMLRGDLGFNSLSGGEISKSVLDTSITSPKSNRTGYATSPSCADPNQLISSINNTGSICPKTTCQALSGCNLQPYLQNIKDLAGGDYKAIAVIMCKESSGKKDSTNKNPDGSTDCGLMQINQKGGSCSTEIMDTTNNLKEGIRLYKEKLASVSQSYPNTKKETLAFASYNCCSNGTKPNSLSSDCTKENGFPFTLPKWACPINPGDGRFNMCSVKSYACDLTSCLDQI